MIYRLLAIVKDRLVSFAYWLLRKCNHEVPFDKISRSYSISTDLPLDQQDTQYRIEMTKLINTCKPYIRTDIIKGSKQKKVTLTIKVAVPDKITDPTLEAYKNLHKI